MIWFALIFVTLFCRFSFEIFSNIFCNIFLFRFARFSCSAQPLATTSNLRMKAAPTAPTTHGYALRFGSSSPHFGTVRRCSAGSVRSLALFAAHSARSFPCSLSTSRHIFCFCFFFVFNWGHSLQRRRRRRRKQLTIDAAGAVAAAADVAAYSGGAFLVVNNSWNTNAALI